MYTSIVFIEWKRQWISISWHRHHHWWSKTRRKKPHAWSRKKHKQRRTKLSKIGQTRRSGRRWKRKNQRIELTLITSTTVLSSSLFLFRLRPSCLLVYSICVLFFFSLIPCSSLSFRYFSFTLRLYFGKFCVFAFGRSIAKHGRFRHRRRKP